MWQQLLGQVELGLCIYVIIRLSLGRHEHLLTTLVPPVGEHDHHHGGMIPSIEVFVAKLRVTRQPTVGCQLW